MVELLPGTRNQDLSCNILPLSLNDRKHDACIALSYMWNDESNVATEQSLANIRTEQLLYQDGTFLKISKNLNNFLRSLRKPEKPTLLWIDQLSINQDDKGEKSRQVQMMQHIYHKAQ